MKNPARTAKLCVVFVFVAILIIGLLVFDDYGLSADEIAQHRHAVISYRDINRTLLGRTVFAETEPNVTLAEYRSKSYGVAMQLPLVFIEDMYQVLSGAAMPSRTVYLTRHLYTFLVYYFALICFYYLLKHLFNSPWLGLCGVLMLYLFGRFFAQSNYNIKDMLFTSLLMIALSCAERVLATGRRPLWCILFAVSGALLVSSRIVGALLIAFLLLAMLLQDLCATRQAKASGVLAGKQSVWKKLLPYALICCAYPIWIILTPAAWPDPIGFSIGYATKFSNYDAWNGAIAFSGEVLPIGEAGPRRRYLITWIALTVPLVNLALSLGGITAFFSNILSRKRNDGLAFPARATLSFMLGLAAFTLLYQIVRQPVLYNGWRHVYYLYPCIIAFAVYALYRLFDPAKSNKPARVWLRRCAVAALAGSLLFNAYSIAKSHPYEAALFNIAGKPRAIGFERDYWYLSHLEALQWILSETDSSGVKIIDLPHAYQMLTPEEQRRVTLAYPHMTDPDEQRHITLLEDQDADYIVLSYTNFAGSNEAYIDGFEEVYSIWLENVKLCAVYRRVAAIIA